MRKALRAAGRQISRAACSIPGLIAAVFGYLWKVTKSSGKYVWGLHPYTKVVIGVLLAMCIIFVLGIQIKQQIRDSLHWRYWTQVVTGNWSPDQPTKRQYPANGAHLATDEYYYGVFLAFLLNWASIALIFTVLWRIYKLERSVNMEMSDAIIVRDTEVKRNLYRLVVHEAGTSLSRDRRLELMESINKIFNTANNNLPERIRTGFGDKGNKFLEDEKQFIEEIIHQPR
jgi:hypothetical protein